MDYWEALTELWIPGVLEVTEALENILGGRRLPGEIWVLSREGGRATGAVLGVYSNTLPENAYRPWWSIIPVLERFYHEKDLALGVENPIPRKTFLEPREGPVPALVKDLTAPRPHELPPTPEVLEEIRRKLRDAAKGKFPPPGKPSNPQSSTNGHDSGKGGGK